MIRISEEQKAILNCYSGTKEKVAEELGRAIPFIEDPELRESAYELLSGDPESAQTGRERPEEDATLELDDSEVIPF